ncbi:MAG: TonB-dependent receptor [Bacteroidaceae bacterium]|nr:TonB-dependent receptor [Bacteroidaceae bacterium]
MKKQFKLLASFLLLSSAAMAQVDQTVTKTNTDEEEQKTEQTEGSFTFTESQMGEDDDASQNVTIMSSNNNMYANQVGFLFSPMRFRYRAMNQKYNEVYMNGVMLNDMESGQFRFTNVGGLNQQTKNAEFALPFEANNFSMSGMAGNNNYNFRAISQAAGSRVTLTGANRNYSLRAMYTYGSGISDKGWSYAANITYRGATPGTAYIDGTFYNSLSYYLGVSKLINGGEHTLSFSTWGNPTERGSQGAATDEMYWIANDRYYNPYWGYQNGKKRNSRIVNDFSPSAIFTWDWNINDKMKLVSNLFAKYSMYKGTKLNYNNSDNPQPNYYKRLPSNFYNPWSGVAPTETELADWQMAYDFLSSSVENRQIAWDQLYASNRGVNQQGQDAMYYLQAKNNNQLQVSVSSALNWQLSKDDILNAGVNAARSSNRHYLTMADLLGANTFHNINTYALSKYSATADEVQYDLRNPNAKVGKGDKFGHDYAINVTKANLWADINHTAGILNVNVAGRIGYTGMNRYGYMQNGICKDYSYGASKTANFLDGGAKLGLNLKLFQGATLTGGVGYEWKAPQASTAFISPEMCNDFVTNLKNEKVFSSELGLQYQNSLLKLNLTGYYSHISDITEWQNYYYDATSNADYSGFMYVSLTGIEKNYYGVEAAARIKLNSALSLKLIGTISDALYLNDADVTTMQSTSGNKNIMKCYTKDIRENGTPLTATSIGLSYANQGWYIDLNANWYDRIYLSYSTYNRFDKVVEESGNVDNDGNFIYDNQARGHGGWMIDASIGRSIRMKKGSLSINLSLTNLLNNRNIVTGGYEQSRSDRKASGGSRTYQFSKNPMKFYAYGTNGMLNIAYKF